MTSSNVLADYIANTRQAYSAIRSDGSHYSLGYYNNPQDAATQVSNLGKLQSFSDKIVPSITLNVK